MARTTRTSQKAATAADPHHPVVAPRGKKAPVAKQAPQGKKAPVAKSPAKAKIDARNKALEKAKTDARSKALDQAKTEARNKALEQAKTDARKKAIEQAKDEARERVAPAQVKAANNKPIENKDKKEANLLYLRTALASAFSNQFKGSGWSIPAQDAITNLNNNEFVVSHKVGNTEYRCKMEMDQDTASFQLTPVSSESLEGLNRSFAAYLESYNKWRAQQNLQGNKDYDLTFTLNVQNQEDLKVILKGLNKDCKITKFEMKGTPIPAAEIELIQNEIAQENNDARPRAKRK